MTVWLSAASLPSPAYNFQKCVYQRVTAFNKRLGLGVGGLKLPMLITTNSCGRHPWYPLHKTLHLQISLINSEEILSMLHRWTWWLGHSTPSLITTSTQMKGTAWMVDGSWTPYFLLKKKKKKTFYNCVVQMGFLQWEIQIAFPRESQLWQSRVAQPKAHAGCFRVSVIHWTLTRTTGSLMCARM